MFKILIFLLLFTFGEIKADQNDKRLNDLFHSLQKPESVDSHDKILEQIWLVWNKIDNPDTQKIMDSLPLYFANQKYEEAISILNNIIDQFPGYAEAYNKRATIFFILGDYNLSMIDIENTLNLEPRHFGALGGMARILLYSEKYQDAIEVYNKIKLIMPYDETIDLKINIVKKNMSVNI